MAAPYVIRFADLDLFGDCTKAELRKIGSLTTYVRVPRDRVLMREGNRADEFVVIGAGTAHVSRQGDGGVVGLADVGSGDFVGEMGLLSGTSRTATVTATTDLEVLVSSISEFRSILHVAPSVAEKIVRASAARSTSLDIAA
jgi:CRP/FNR family cyclic AMP-dependent transcriptional regulator